MVRRWEKPPSPELQLHGPAAQGQVQLPAEGEDGIAHGLEFQAMDVGPPEEAVLRIDLGVARVVLAALLVGVGKHDEAVQFLDATSRPA